VRDGVTVALLEHRPGLLDEPTVVEEVERAVRLGLDNERLRAELSVRLADLRASRERLVASADDARRQLERDLHDGAQQSLVSVAMLMRVARVRAPAARQASLDEAAAAVADALASLRRLAHGLHPAALSDAGLGAAVQLLADTADVWLRVGPMPTGRLERAVEAAAYAVVAAAVGGGGDAVTVTAEVTDGTLVVTVCGCNLGVIDVVDLSDRVGAVDGALAAGDGTLVARLPVYGQVERR
jgi:signal transduction histidine kinase